MPSTIIPWELVNGFPSTVNYRNDTPPEPPSPLPKALGATSLRPGGFYAGINFLDVYCLAPPRHLSNLTLQHTIKLCVDKILETPTELYLLP